MSRNIQEYLNNLVNKPRIYYLDLNNQNQKQDHNCPTCQQKVNYTCHNCSNNSRQLTGEITNLSEFRNLKGVNVSNHTFTNLNFLNTLPNKDKLKGINLFGNQITEIDFADLVEKLDCSNNRLENLEGLSECFRLVSLDCSRNLLTDLSFLSFPCLENKLIYLDISENKFFEKGLICFRSFDSLKELKINAADVSRSLGKIYEHLYDHLKESKNIIVLDKLKEEHSKLVIIERKLSEQKKDGDLLKQWKINEEKESIVLCKEQISKIIEKADLGEKYASGGREEKSLIYSLKLEFAIARLMGLVEAQERELTHYRSQPNQQIFINKSSVGNIVFRDINQTTYQQCNVQYQQLVVEVEQQTSESLAKCNVAPEEQQIINQTILFLGTKELFINYRQIIINRLIDCYCKLANKKYTRFTRATSLMGITSKIVGSVPGGELAQSSLGVIGDVASLAGIIKQSKDLERCQKEFKKILGQDRENLSLFHAGYQSLIQAIWPNNDQGKVIKNIINTLQLKNIDQRTFYDEHRVQEWNLCDDNSEKLKSFVVELDDNLKNLRAEFQEQRNQLTNQNWFKIIEEKTDLLKQQQALVEIPHK